MRICQVLGGDEEGGLEKHFEELCNQMVLHHEVHVVAHEKYKDRFHKNIFFHALDLSKGRRNIVILYQLHQMINQIEPDILHAHANKAVDMIASIKRFLLPSIKLIATLHSKKRKLKSFEKFDHVIGVSHEVLKEVKNPYQSVVYNGIDISPQKKNPHFLETFGIKDEFVISAVGRLEQVKNFSLLIRAVKDLDVKLVIVGEGSEKESLTNLVKEIRIEEKVIFTGFREDVLNIIAHSNICTISSDREGFSYVMAEALLLRIPVVSTDVGDMKKILPKGCVVPVNDEAKLTETLRFMKDNYQDALESYEQSFKFAAEHFTLGAMAKQVLSIYSRIAGK
jgi:glycosyltransferase involved in cell wall biosynthesis